MDTDTIAAKYNIHAYSFEMFLRQNNLECFRFGSLLIVKDDKVEEYVNMYKAQNGNRGF